MDFKNVDINSIQNAYNQAKENGYSDQKLEGSFRVKIEKIELGETGKDSKNPGSPMGKIQMRIVEGEHKKQCLFMNKVLVSYDKEGKLNALGLKIFDDFLNSLKPEYDGKVYTVSFSECKGPNPFKEYAEKLLDVAEDIEGFEYEVEVTYKNDFPNFKITKCY